MFGLGPMELVIVFLIILLVFGAKRIPEIAQGLGKGITEFKKAARDVTSEFDVSENNNTQTRNELRGQSNQQQTSNQTSNQTTKAADQNTDTKQS